ncbi:MAG TPA: maltose acetyltransferase domain-containing protein [Devosia sp.]
MTNRTGYEKMRAGEPYANPDWDLIGMQVAAREKLDIYNQTATWMRAWPCCPRCSAAAAAPSCNRR